MSDIKNGGPAFPHTKANGANSGDVGMTLRDYFAAKAMQVVMDGSPTTPYGNIARYAYEMADAMLAAREAK